MRKTHPEMAHFLLTKAIIKATYSTTHVMDMTKMWELSMIVELFLFLWEITEQAMYRNSANKEK